MQFNFPINLPFNLPFLVVDFLIKLLKIIFTPEIFELVTILIYFALKEFKRLDYSVKT